MIDLHKTLDTTDPEAKNFLNNLQGNILKPHGRQYTTLMLLTFKRQNYYFARNWLSQFATPPLSVTSGLEEEKLHVTSALPEENRDRNKPFCMALLSFYGYQKLYENDSYNSDIPVEDTFKLSTEGLFFSSGSSSSAWNVSEKIDAIIMLAHDDQNKLHTFEQELVDQVSLFSTEPVPVKHGFKLPGPGHQQIDKLFGFAEGISGPLFIQQAVDAYCSRVGSDLRWDPATSLDQVLVPETQKHDDEITTYGSYMAFFQIQQDSELFQNTFN